MWTNEILHNMIVQMKNSGGFECVFTFLHASNIYRERETLWEYLIMNVTAIELSWLVLGDFDNASSPKDWKGVAYPFIPYY